jgi:integrase
VAGVGEPTTKSEHLPQKGRILSYALEMKKNGLADSTAQTAIERLTRMSKSCDLDDPEQIRTFLANAQWKNRSKQIVADIYTGYLKYQNRTWNKPHYKKESTIPFIPTEQEIDTLISAGTPKTATLYEFLKETLARIGETLQVEWKDIDPIRQTVAINHPEKYSNARIVPIKAKLLAMLDAYPKINNKVFQQTDHSARHTLEYLRQRTAKKLNNPRLKQIHLHTFRHFGATMEYHKTKDIIHVKNLLGHKDIEATMIYINIENALFLTQCDDFITIVTHNEKEEIEANNNGFTLIRDRQDGTQLYKKRK